MDIGARLQHAREQRGLTLRDIADVTKISIVALRAIERNDFARLPGGLFRRAYIRAFASEVGLNADALAREYRATFEADAPSNPVPQPEEASDARSRVVRRVAVVSAIGVGLMIGGLLFSNPAQNPQAPRTEKSILTDGDDPGLPVRATPVDLAAGEDDVAVTDAKVVAVDGPSLQLDIRAIRTCWVSAVADGERVAYRLMQAGDRVVIEAQESITLRIGDASAIDYSINGATGRRLGRSGEVITVRFTAANVDRYADPRSALPSEGEASRVRQDSRRSRLETSLRRGVTGRQFSMVRCDPGTLGKPASTRSERSIDRGSGTIRPSA
jgi:cytoskeletal protein RodZ